MCVDTNVSVHKRVWAQTCLYRHKHVWHKYIWAQLCGYNRKGSNMYCMGTIVWSPWKSLLLLRERLIFFVTICQLCIQMTNIYKIILCIIYDNKLMLKVHPILFIIHATFPRAVSDISFQIFDSLEISFGFTAPFTTYKVWSLNHWPLLSTIDGLFNNFSIERTMTFVKNFNMVSISEYSGNIYNFKIERTFAINKTLRKLTWLFDTIVILWLVYFNFCAN